MKDWFPEAIFLILVAYKSEVLNIIIYLAKAF